MEIIIFGMHGCPDCDYQRKLMDEKLPQYKYKFVDIESDELDDVVLLSKYSIETIPTIVIDKNGAIFSHEGKLASHKILDVING
jgi:glutaredoxin